jgi:hypothetical protein
MIKGISVVTRPKKNTSGVFKTPVLDETKQCWGEKSLTPQKFKLWNFHFTFWTIWLLTRAPFQMDKGHILEKLCPEIINVKIQRPYLIVLRLRRHSIKYVTLI